jgi:hypothetical protein
MVLLTLAMVDALVPTHTVLRYEKSIICNDTDRVGGLDRDVTNKEWRCKRCCLLDLIQYPREEVVIHIDILGVGNVL